ncbi:MAG: hypothetical protein AAF570_26730, partial [Bacteroidota bacterium]
GNTGNNGGNNDDEETPPPPPPAPKAYGSYAAKTIPTGTQFYIDVDFRKGTGTDHKIQTSGGVSVHKTEKMGEGGNQVARVHFLTAAAGPATIKIARVKDSKKPVKISAKTWAKADSYTLTVSE